jgi:MFS family permease
VTSYSIQELHVNSELGFYLISLINAAQFLGRLLPAWTADYHHALFGPEAFHFLALLFMGILGFAWIGITSPGELFPWLIFYGFFSGTAVTLPAIVVLYICPNLAVYGTRIGMLYACSGVGLLISTPIASALNSSSGSFLGSQVWTGACCLVASLLFVVTGLECRKRRLQYEIGKRRKRGTRAPRPRIRPEWLDRAISKVLPWKLEMKIVRR